MPYLSLKNGSLYYEVQGQGEPMVLLRGLGRSCRYWLDFDRRVGRDFQVITLDHRGLGKSSVALRWWHSIDHMVDDLRCLLDHLKIDRAHFFGLSLGGMVAMGFAARYPERCQTLMVANSSSADYWGMRVDPKALQTLTWKAYRQGFHKVLLELVTTPEQVKKNGHKIQKAWQLIRDEEGFPITTIAKQLWCASRFRIGGRLHGADLPIMILYGEQDQFVPPRNSLMIHRLIPQSNLHAFSQAGHEISIGHEQKLVELMRRFVKKKTGKRTANQTLGEAAKTRKKSSAPKKGRAVLIPTPQDA
ncbi:MAG: alpha/beta fold hydrolase [Oligoflexus sp.]